MKITLNLTREVRDTSYGYSSSRTKTETVVDVTAVEFTTKLTGSFLRALADEIDPPKSAGYASGGIITNPLSGTLR